MDSNKIEAWNVDQYRHPWECDEHWEIRREFILKYKDNFPEDNLVCLAQVYTNIELLGCRYPAEVTKQINYLAEDLKKQNKIKERQQIKFVKSSNVQNRGDVHSQGKPGKSYNCSQMDNKAARMSSNRQDSSNELCSVSKNDTTSQESVPSYFTSNYRNNMSSTENGQASTVKTICDMNSLSDNPCLDKEKKIIKASNSCYLNRQVDQCSKNILPQPIINLLRKHLKNIQQGDANMNKLHLMNQCASKAHVLLDWKIELDSQTPGFFVCTLLVDQNPVSTGRGQNKKTSRINACTEFMNYLMDSKNDKMQGNKAEHPKNAKVTQNRSNPGNEQQNSLLNNPLEFVLIETWNNSSVPAYTILNQSAHFNKKIIKYQFETCEQTLQTRCEVLLDESLVASATECSKQKAKMEAADKALERLKESCYTIRQKIRINSEGEISKGSVAYDDPYECIPDDNVGSKMMRLMGWSGGGLGKGGDGIEEPVRLRTVIGRSGLGCSASGGEKKAFRKIITEKIINYINSNSMNDLAFTSEFSKEERKEIHMIAQRHHLKSVSYGKGEDRQLVISRKWTSQSLLDFLRNSGGSNEKYELIPPTGMEWQ